MEANELRIGNYVMHKNNIVVVSGINNEYVRYDKAPFNDGDWDYLENIYSIPITNELLLRLGFSITDHPLGKCYEMATSYEWFYLIDNGDFYTFGIENDYSPKSVIRCNSLHQLQNRFFAFTGKELEVKL